jgi:hypothetical protein
MHRRSFLSSLGSTLAVPGTAARLLGGSAAGKPYGSGSFGEWIEDESGLPAFRYTCDQIHDPKAVTSLGPGILSPTDHIHQVGNDRLVAVVSNYGHVQVRQDEGGPKFLNDHSPERSQFGGGVGYLSDGKEILSTYYPGNARSFDRIFGMGYFRKRVAGERYSIDQVISAPFGDDPVLLSQVSIRNHGESPVELRWIEYWGCQVYEFSLRSFMEVFAGIGPPVELRRQLGDRFTHRFERLEGAAGLMETKHFQGRTPEEEGAWQKVKAVLAARRNPFFGPVQDGAPGASFDDLQPPATFLVSLDSPADGIATNAKKFFGAGGVARPAGLESGLDGDLSASGTESGLLLERKIALKPGEQRTVYFLYGYLPEGTEPNTLISRYRSDPARVWKDSCAQWRKAGLRFSTANEPWIKREVTWNYYYLRSALTYDRFFGEHILSQGGIYQYTMGFQGAARDPLQHALPFIFSDPAIVKEILRYTLKEVRADGSIPYGIVGHGTVMPTTSDNSSDMPLWLLWAVSEYVLATRDRAFLNEQIPARLDAGPGAGRESVRKLLARCYRHLIEHVGTGEHRLMRMLNDDWNDALVIGWAQRASKECVERGESVLNSAMAAYVFDYYARLLVYAGEEPTLAAQAREKAAEHRKAVRAQWTGKWFRRAWLGPTLGWLGEQGLWLEPQPWAIIGGTTTPEQTRDLVRTVDEVLRRPSPIGAMQMNKSPDTERAAFEAGTAVSGGIWPSLNATLIWALAQADGRMAWDEWLKNTSARHAEEYPHVWYGTWSGPDTINSSVSKHPGETVSSGFLHYTDFPVMNLHWHACSLYALSKLLGLEFTEAGLNLTPVLPLPEYRFESPLVGLIKTSAGFEGWYSPSQPGAWTIRLQLPPEEARLLTKLEVNGARVRRPQAPGGRIEFRGKSPLRWSLRRP